MVHDLFRGNRANAFDEATAQVATQPFQRGRYHLLNRLGTELTTMFTVAGPAPGQAYRFAGLQFRQRADHRQQALVSLPGTHRLRGIGPQANDCVASFVAVVRDALYDPFKSFMLHGAIIPIS